MLVCCVCHHLCMLYTSHHALVSCNGLHAELGGNKMNGGAMRSLVKCDMRVMVQEAGQQCSKSLIEGE